MGELLPKLLVLGGPHVDADALEQSLSRYFELIETSPADAITTLEGEGCQAVLAEAGDFLPLERDLVGRQSSMLLNAIGEGVCLCDVSGRILWANAMFGGFSEVVRRRVATVCAMGATAFNEALRAAPEPTNGDAPSPPKPKRYKLAFRRTRRYYEVLVSPVPNRPGAPRRDLVLVAAVVRDVTAAERIERKIEAIEVAGRELGRLDPETVRTRHSSERLSLLQERVVRHARELLNFDHFAVRMLNPRTNELELVMSAGIPEEARAVRLYAEKEGGGISGYVAATGEPYISNDTSEDARYVFGLTEPGSSLTVPLKAYDQIVGVFNVESTQRNAFGPHDRHFAEIFAGHLAGALHTLNLLLVERVATNETATGAVQGEISGPLNDLAAEIELLKKQAGSDGRIVPHLERITRDVASIRKRVKNVGRGPRTMLGADDVLETGGVDPELRGRRVLIADNDDDILQLIRDVLVRKGCRVVTCDDGTSAIRLLETWRVTHDAEEGFDLVLSDINLGDRTGYDVFESARKADDAIPVILMTGFGYDPHHSIVRATQEGLRAVLFKPFQAAKLIDEVRAAFKPAQAEGAAG